MADDDKGQPDVAAVASTEGKIAGVPLDVFVKGGTTSSAWDNEQAALGAQSDYLREHQDRQYQAIADAQRHGGALAGMFSKNLLHRGNPKVVIEYVYRDSALNRECLAELYTYPMETDPTKVGMGLVVVCPKCLARTGRQGMSQLNIRSEIREFYLRSSSEPDFPEDKRVWVNPVDGQVHQIAGTITTATAIKCTALGCDWKFRIDDSKLREV